MSDSLPVMGLGSGSACTQNLTHNKSKWGSPKIRTPPEPPCVNASAEQRLPLVFLPNGTSHKYPQPASGKNSSLKCEHIPGIWLRVISRTDSGLSILTPP